MVQEQLSLIRLQDAEVLGGGFIVEGLARNCRVARLILEINF